MIAIVMTYYDRQYQLEKTLKSFNSDFDFGVIIVDDASPEDIVLPDLDFPVIIKKVNNKKWVNGVPAYNIGFDEAINIGADIVIIQNAECYHVGDIIGYANAVTQNEYIAFGCYSINEQITFSEHDIIEVIRENNIAATEDGQNAWYNHSILRPVGYHFCSAIRTENLIKLNGFDERFAYGIGYEDNYFLHQVRTLGLRLKITDYPFVVHQWHYNQKIKNKDSYVNYNQVLYHQLIMGNHYKAKRII